MNRSDHNSPRTQARRALHETEYRVNYQRHRIERTTPKPWKRRKNAKSA